MKQIKKLSLSNVISKLTRNEMRYVMAGSGSSGSCAVRIINGDGEILVKWGTKAEITDLGGNGGGNSWCCESCSTASWINSCNIC